MEPEKIKTKYGVVSKTDNKLVIHHNDGNIEGFVKESVDEGIMNNIRHSAELILIVGLGMVYFNTDITIVSGVSMSPTYHNYQVIIKSKVSTEVDRLMLNKGTVIKFKDPSKITSIKRIVGVPGDLIEFDFRTVRINGEVVDVNNSEYPPPGASFKKAYSKSGKLYSRTGKYATLKLKGDEYFVMGDNKDNSEDSRAYGAIKETAIISIVDK